MIYIQRWDRTLSHDYMVKSCKRRNICKTCTELTLKPIAPAGSSYCTWLKNASTKGRQAIQLAVSKFRLLSNKWGQQRSGETKSCNLRPFRLLLRFRFDEVFIFLSFLPGSIFLLRSNTYSIYVHTPVKNYGNQIWSAFISVLKSKIRGKALQASSTLVRSMIEFCHHYVSRILLISKTYEASKKRTRTPSLRGAQ